MWSGKAKKKDVSVSDEKLKKQKKLNWWNMLFYNINVLSTFVVISISYFNAQQFFLKITIKKVL